MIDIVRVGESIITAHHHIQTTDGWMTARQAAAKGYGDFVSNCAIPRVYNFCLEGGRNILINTTANLHSAPTWTTAATLGCRFQPEVDPQHTDSLTYPDDIRIRLDWIKGMQCGHKPFFALEVQTLPNGELHIESMRSDLPTSEEKRPGTAPLPSRHHTTTPLKRSLVPRRPAQLESDTANVTGKKENRGEPDKRTPGHPDTPYLVIKTCHRLPEESLHDQDVAKEDWPTPSFTPDTHILIRNADKASWIQPGNASRGATVVQSLPSGNIEDLRGATSTTIETVYQLERPAGGIDIVQIGKAYITAHHHIQTVEGWMTARQAADRGHGTFLSDHVYPKFYSLLLVVGGNIIFNTSASPDQAPTQIEAATMGYVFLPLAKPPNTNTPTCPRQETGPRDSRAAQAQLSYCQVAQRQLTGMSDWPTLQSVPLAPKTTARLESKTVTEGGAREHKGEPNIGSMGLPATTQLDPRTGQRLSEEYGGEYDTFLKLADTLRPEEPGLLLRRSRTCGGC